MPNTKTVRVPHLFGTDAAYQMPRPYDASKPTCVLINSFTMTSDLYEAQYKNEKLLDSMNILAVEPYGGYSLRHIVSMNYLLTTLYTTKAMAKRAQEPIPSPTGILPS